ncbi:hypothetical protein LIER_22007 [Lithospermum erythrorhizon]|uniref:Uncharacterized protein n=1 Tax=Lithospermum erythrorhizon TaxID=34254 RepID=A0AAV3QVF7_LITER
MTYPCTCHQANEQGDKVVPVLPRKLKVNEEEIVKDYGKKDLAFEPLFNKIYIYIYICVCVCVTNLKKIVQVKDYGKKDLAFEPLFNKNDVASSGLKFNHSP